jgi:formate/nitrite transporter FocA (FNT family)
MHLPRFWDCAPGMYPRHISPQTLTTNDRRICQNLSITVQHEYILLLHLLALVSSLTGGKTFLLKIEAEKGAREWKVTEVLHGNSMFATGYKCIIQRSQTLFTIFVVMGCLAKLRLHKQTLVRHFGPQGCA